MSDTSTRELGPAAELLDIADRHRVRLGSLELTGHRRRPSGARPPLPRPLRASGWLWLVGGALVALAWASLFTWPETVRWWYQRDHEVIRALAAVRNAGLDRAAAAGAALGSIWVVRAGWLVTLAALAYARRWHRMVAAAVLGLIVEWSMTVLALELMRERPLGVEIIGDWSGSSHPSLPVASLTVAAVVAAMVLLPAGVGRRRAMTAVMSAVAAVIVCRVYLGVDHPTDGLFAALFAGAVGFVGIRLLAPDGAFPASLRRSQPAHLEIGGARTAAIQAAMADQAGIVVEDVRPHGLEGSAGSTPLLITVAGHGEQAQVFGKLYSSTHLRSDRAYKVARTILYGALEDEFTFTSVSRLVEYEDYMLRVTRDAGVPCPQPIGFVELTPEREYLVITEFLDGAQPILEAPVDELIGLDAIGVVRRLWDGRLAHRDIKPSNVMVRDGRVVLVDVAFTTARPTPWRQAVDLANMMLILSLRLPLEQVYDLARMEFAAEDIAEAFAATHGVTLPAELRRMLKAARGGTGVDHVAAFRALAPHREPIHIQRWSTRRAGLLVGGAGAATALAYIGFDTLRRTGIL